MNNNNNYYRRRRRRRSRSYFFPFILLIAVVVAIYFLTKGVGFLLSVQVDDPAITVYIEQGSVSLTPADDPTRSIPAISSQKVLPGDVVKTGIGTRAVLDFFGTAQVRLAPNSELVIEKAVNTKRQQAIITRLNAGNSWIDMYSVDPDKKGEFLFKTPNLLTEGYGVKYALKAKLPEVVRVYEGEVRVSVLDPEKTDGESILETVPVSIAQQFELTSTALSAFQKRETPTVLSAIDPEFEETSWYEWNKFLDGNLPLVASFDGNSPVANIGIPNGLALFAQEAVDAEEDTENPEDEDESLDEDSDEVEAAPLPVPVITRPKNDFETEDTVIIIEGTVGQGAFGIEVTSFEKGFANPYRLQKFEEGNATWRYIANVDGGNLVEGENRFEIRSIGEDGDKSEPVKLLVTYEAPELELDPDDSGVEIDPTTGDPILDEDGEPDPVLDEVVDPDAGEPDPEVPVDNPGDRI